MDVFTTHTGVVLPLDRANIDTDALLPKQYLKAISKFGYGDWLFDNMRYLDSGNVETVTATRRINPDFVLNQSAYKLSSIVLARENFGCGSSREHAVWALRDYGIRTVIAPSFADIFYNNCFKNGVLPLQLEADQVDALFQRIDKNPGCSLTIDLERQQISAGEELLYNFQVDPERRELLLNGWDDITISLQKADLIRQYEARQRELSPWLFYQPASAGK